MIPLKNQAIQTALLGDWQTAITLNLELLKENPDDIDTLNRLAFAYAVVGKPKEARNTYYRVLRIDPQNPIAQKNLKRFSGVATAKPLKESSFASQTPKGILNNMFVEEHGKTKVIELVNIADPKIIALLHTGEFLTMQVKRSKIFVLDNQKLYVGMLPQDLGGRLITFINGGNVYEVYIKAIEKRKVTVFIKEVKRANKFKNQSSFLSLPKSKMRFDTHSKASSDVVEE